MMSASGTSESRFLRPRLDPEEVMGLHTDRDRADAGGTGSLRTGRVFENRVGSNVRDSGVGLTCTAINQFWRGEGLGAALGLDAIRRTLRAAEIARVRVRLVYPKDDPAAVFPPVPVSSLFLASSRSFPSAPSPAGDGERVTGGAVPTGSHSPWISGEVLLSATT